MIIDTTKLGDWILSRLREQSTWRGILLIITAAGVKIKPDQAENIIVVGLSLVGAINVLRNEKKGNKNEKDNSAQPPVS